MPWKVTMRNISRLRRMWWENISRTFLVFPDWENIWCKNEWKIRKWVQVEEKHDDDIDNDFNAKLRSMRCVAVKIHVLNLIYFTNSTDEFIKCTKSTMCCQCLKINVWLWMFDYELVKIIKCSRNSLRSP